MHVHDEPKEFGDSITADHAILNEETQSGDANKVALVVHDRATSWQQAFPAKNKSAGETMTHLQRFMGPKIKPKYIFTDNSKELEKAAKDLGWLHDTSTPYRPETNGVAERDVRRIKEGTSAAIVQSGWDEVWWPEAMRCYCFLHNVVDVLANGHTAYFNRFGIDFSGPIIPSGAEVMYKPY